MSAAVSLEDLRAAYKRTSGRIYRILEDGYDFGVADIIIGALDRDAQIIDAAFFVLVFGQVESRINELASRRVAMEQQRYALRAQRFERRLGLALTGAQYRTVREELITLYRLRNDAAHGERLAEYDVEALFRRADHLEGMLREKPIHA
jgi:hypothetical protein